MCSLWGTVIIEEYVNDYSNDNLEKIALHARRRKISIAGAPKEHVQNTHTQVKDIYCKCCHVPGVEALKEHLKNT
jgi:hypothetical protein